MTATRPRQEQTLATSAYFTARGGLHNIKGNHAPYFTLQGEERDRHGKVIACGCMHDEVLRRWPQFTDLAALHLSDIDGVPMHAEGNGWYDLAGSLPNQAGEQYHAGNSQQHFPKAVIDPDKPWANTDYRNPTPDEYLQIFADHVRVDVQVARELRDELIRAWIETRAECEPSVSDDETETFAWGKASWKSTRARFAQWIEEQKPRWKKEAEACIARHGLVVFGD